MNVHFDHKINNPEQNAFSISFAQPFFEWIIAGESALLQFRSVIPTFAERNINSSHFISQRGTEIRIGPVVLQFFFSLS